MSEGSDPASEAARRRLERAAARRRNDRRGFAIAATSTLVVLGGLAALVLTSSGWPDVQDSFFNPGDFAAVFPEILEAFWLDIKIFMVVEVAVLALGLLVALVRVTRGPALFPVRLLATVYTDVFRGIPTILLIYLVGFGVPALTPGADPDNFLISGVFLGSVALMLSYGAYVSEVYRAGVQSVERGQHEAALSVGLTQRQALRHVIVPQGVRRVGPPLLNDFIALQKDVALLSILGVVEAFRFAQIEASTNFIYTPLVAAAMLYLLITIPLARLLDHYDRRSGEGGRTR
ncbi:amino acid ABC transporter permease [Thermoleophilia bacterium SCSIO 60948]|nr:amino acid ABC transporter permease [Thermoleophilia bacterium SCSIO 60948]